MGKKTKVILWTVFALALAAFIAWILMPKPPPEKAKPGPDPNKVPTIVTHDVNALISNNGQTRYRVTSKLWNQFEQAKKPFWTFPNGIVIDSLDSKQQIVASLVCDSAHYDEQQKYASAVGHVRITMRIDDPTSSKPKTITCRRAYYDDNRKVAQFKDSVLVTFSTGETIVTNEAFWNTRDGHYYGKLFVRLKGNGRVVEGYGFDAWDRNDSFVIREVKAVLPIDDRKFMSN